MLVQHVAVQSDACNKPALELRGDEASDNQEKNRRKAAPTRHESRVA